MAGAFRLRLGTRASALARWQAEWVASQLASRGIAVELVPITTEGDVKSGPLAAIGGQGLFTKELQRALLDSRIDLAVHSLKDLPTTEIDGLTIAAVPPRETTADCLVSHKAAQIEDLPPAARVGTGSLRRQAQLLHLRPDLIALDIRGNVETRLRKLDEGHFDAIVLAEAGLKRLGLMGPAVHVNSKAVMLSAVGPGALGIDTRADDATTHALQAPHDDSTTHRAVVAERSLLAALRAGCLAPVGALAEANGDWLRLEAVVLHGDGKQRLFATASAALADAVSLGQQVAENLLSQGAADLIAASRRSD
jgi:hydroxymethylbilane synthase